jgi:hypothetical protein
MVGYMSEKSAEAMGVTNGPDVSMTSATVFYNARVAGIAG